MITSSEQRRAWTGPAILSFGFRPFFLMAAIWAASAMAIWVGMLTGRDILPTAFAPTAWHSHELLFGYLGAVVAGFFLTAVPNWTGSLPLVGWPLAGLASLWVVGRVAVGTSAYLPPLLAALADLTFPVALTAFLAREIFAGRNWKNLPILALLTGWAIANALFHWEAAQGGSPAQGFGLRIGVAVAVLLISLIGGRIVPSFTRNWLAQRKAERLPVPFGRTDGVVLALTVFAGALDLVAGRYPYVRGLWVGGVGASVADGTLAGPSDGRRGARLGAACGLCPCADWVYRRCTWPDSPQSGPGSAAYMDGGGGRPDDACGDDTGKPWPCRTALHATAAITALYLALIVAVLARLLSGVLPGQIWPLHLASGAWIAAFGGFAVIYWPILALPRKAMRQPNRAARPEG